MPGQLQFFHRLGQSQPDDILQYGPKVPQLQQVRFFCYNKKDKLVILSAYLENDF